MKLKRIFILPVVVLTVMMLGGCGMVNGIFNNVTSLVGLSKTGTVITRSQIRSSYAVVAADLLEVNRGEVVDIADETVFEKVHWYRVRAHDEDNTEGWIEAQNLILSDVLDKTKKLALEDKDIQPQAIGQLRAASNLRLSPESSDNNILFKLDNGSNFEITGWKFTPKIQDTSDADDNSNNAQKQSKSKSKNPEIEAALENDEPDKLDDKYDIWYKVRLDPSVSPAPAGWLFGRQVELQLPNDILFFQQNNKKFVAWQRLDNPDSYKLTDKDTAMKITKPGSWVVLTRSNAVKPKDGVEPAFDGIIVYAYDKYNEEHYMAYRSGELWGQLPLKLDGTADNKTFTVPLVNNSGQLEEKRFVVTKDAKEHLRVTPPEGLPIPVKN